MLFHPRKKIRELINYMQNVITHTYVYDYFFIKKIATKNLGYNCNLIHPITFNDKINWYKLHDSKEFTNLIDKIEVKKFVASLIGEDKIVKTIFDGYIDASCINWSELPEQFVIKCNHDSGSTLLCKDKTNFDINYANEFLNKALNVKSSDTITRARICKYIKPKILIEEYLGDDIFDYKFFCFHGKVKIYKIDMGRQIKHHCANYYNMDGVLTDCSEEAFPIDKNANIILPNNFNEMVIIAERLASNISRDFIRVDLYNVDGKIYFGELTFYPAGGYGKFVPEKWDYLLGSWI